jgi:hypothetical protein
MSLYIAHAVDVVSHCTCVLYRTYYFIVPSWSTVCFLSLHVFVCFAIWAWKMNFDLDGYTKQSWPKFLTMDIQPTGLSFTLFWTLFYGLVYLY